MDSKRNRNTELIANNPVQNGGKNEEKNGDENRDKNGEKGTSYKWTTNE